MTKRQLRLSGATLAVAAAAFTPVLSHAQTAADSDDDNDTIVVTASPLHKDVNELLVGASIVRQEEIRERMTNSLGELLKAEPGVSSTYFGPGASRPVIRGQGGDRVRVLDNGIGSIDASSTSADHAVAVEPAQAEQVDIIRGSGLLRYGSSGAGGVVNVIDGRMPREVPEGGFSGDIRIGASSVDDGSEIAAAGDIWLGKAGDTDIVLHLDGGLREGDDYDIPGYAESAALRAMEEEDHDDHEDEDHHDDEEHDDHDEDHDEHEHEEEEEAYGTLENSAFETSSASVGLSFINERFLFGFAVKQTDTSYGIPAGHNHAHGHDEDHDDHEDEEEQGHEEGGVTIDLKQTRYDMRGEYSFASGPFDRITAAVGIADYEHREIEPSGEIGTVFTNEGWEGRVELLQRERGGWRGASGVQYRMRDFSAIGEEAFVPPAQTRQAGLFTFQDYATGPWHFEGAARYEMTEHEADTGVSRDFNGFSVSAGAGYDFTDALGLGGTVFRTERAPTTEELFSNGPHLATDAFEIGDPDLDEEVATGAELVLRGQFDRIGFTVNGFYTDYTDYIYEADTGEEEDELPVFAYRASDAVFKGFEAEADIDLGTTDSFAGPVTFGATLGMDYVRATLDAAGNENLPRIPPFGVLAGLSADTDRFGLRAEVDYNAEQDETADFELPTDSYTLVNVFADYRFLPGNDDVLLRLSVMNLTDEEARQHTSFLKDQVPLPGRNVRFSLEASF